MAAVLPVRSNTSSTGTTASGASRTHRRQPSFNSFPSNRAGSGSDGNSTHLSVDNPNSQSLASVPSSAQSYHHQNHSFTNGNAHPSPLPRPTRSQRSVKSQYPPDSTEKHVEYILVASFDIDRGSVMEHQYPGPVGGDEHMLAELMLPDGAHVRAQDWTIFFLHKDGAAEEEAGLLRKRRKRRKRDGVDEQADGGAEFEQDDFADDTEDDEESESSDDEAANVDGPPLVYVLNLVNMKQDKTVKRGAVVKAMAICTRHSFLHIYKPLLLLALQQYFANPVIETLASLYEAVNSMDLSLLPRLSYHEKSILQASDAKDLFLEKFEAIISQRMASFSSAKDRLDPSHSSPSPTTAQQHQQHGRGRFGLPRDTHEFESVVHYSNIPIPVKVPVALSPETVGDFSLIKLITTFAQPHATSSNPFQPNTSTLDDLWRSDTSHHRPPQRTPHAKTSHLPRPQPTLFGSRRSCPRGLRASQRWSSTRLHTSRLPLHRPDQDRRPPQSPRLHRRRHQPSLRTQERVVGRSLRHLHRQDAHLPIRSSKPL